MSGHSKWSTIKRQKGLKDQKKGQTFTKLANAITIAVKQGGGIGDPEQNFRLRLSIDAARAANMPKENVERAIKKATGSGAGEFEEVIYEGFAPGGVSVIVEAATDNPTRTTAEIKSVFNKHSASFGQPGSVLYQFNQIGRIVVSKDLTFDEIFEIAVSAGAEDIEDAEGKVYIYTKYADLSAIREKLEENKLNIIDAQIIRVPQVKIDVTDDAVLSKIENFIEALDANDDVLKIYTNIE